MKIVIAALLLIGFQARADFQTETVPYSFIGGKVDGMKIIKELPSSCGLAKIGVKINDIVVDVDGSPIVNRQAAKEAYSNKSPKMVTVLRNDVQIQLGANL